MNRILVMALGLVAACSGYKDRCVTDDDCLWRRECVDGHCRTIRLVEAPATEVKDWDATMPPDAHVDLDASVPDTAAPPDAGLPDAGPWDASLRDAGIPDAAVPLDAAFPVDAARPPVHDAAVLDCPCDQDHQCIYNQCLPACGADAGCGVGGLACDSQGTGWCQCVDGYAPCPQAGCCAVDTGLLPGPDAGALNWRGMGVSMAVDAWGRVHLAWIEAPTASGGYGFVWYALQNGTGWDRQWLQPALDQGQDPSLVLDELDSPHISYCGGVDGLRYARREADGLMFSWQVGTQPCVQSSLAVRGTPGLDLTVHIAWTAATGELFHETGAFHAGHPPDWTAESIWPSGATDPSLALNTAGSPAVAFFYDQQGNHSLDYAVPVGMGWTVLQMETGFPCDGRSRIDCSPNPSMAFDRHGAAVVAYHDTRVGGLVIGQVLPNPDAGPTDVSWGTTRLDPAPGGDAGFLDVGFHPSLRLNPFDDVVVGYAVAGQTSSHVRLLRYRNGAAVVSVIDRGTGHGVGLCPPDIAGCVALGLSAADEAYLAYFDRDWGQLTVAH